MKLTKLVAIAQKDEIDPGLLRDAEQGNASAQVVIGLCYHDHVMFYAPNIRRRTYWGNYLSEYWFRQAVETVEHDLEKIDALGLCVHFEGDFDHWHELRYEEKLDELSGESNSNGTLTVAPIDLACVRAAEAGVAYAQMVVGRWFQDGMDVENFFLGDTDPDLLEGLYEIFPIDMDPERAIECYTQAATGGNTAAQFLLALCLEDGIGVAVADPAVAFSWYQNAAEQGYAPAQANLGLCFR